jgi:hypothetical protein
MRQDSKTITNIAVALFCAVSLSSGQQTPNPRSDSAAFLAKVAGVYKVQFQNGDVNGDKYQSEDILEVVPVDDHAAYVRMALEFFNGHSGRIYGIAIYEKNSLIYDNGQKGEGRCVVEYVWSSDKVITKADYDKTPGCRSYHGARGSLDRAEFPVKRKRTIHYMPRLKDSGEFKAAMDEYRKARQ